MRAFLVDIADEFVQRGVANIENSLGLFVKKEKLTQLQADEIRGRVIPTTDNACFAEADLIVEAVTENLKIKSQIFATADEKAGADCILASNTSSISITALAAATSRPEQVIGMHFMNPVPLMVLVEVIRGHSTSDGTTERVVEWVARKPADA